MTDKLLAYLLKHVEGSPDATFYESELVRISSSGFSALKKQKYLLFDQYDFEQETYCDKRGNERLVRKVNGRWIATSTEDSGISPIYLNDQDLNRYAFNVKPLLAEIKTKNNLVKNSCLVTPRVWFIGDATVVQNTVGVFLAFLSDDEQASAELLGLRAKIGKMDGILVLCPSKEIKSQDLLSKLAGQNIVCLTFKEAFKKNKAIDFSKVRFNQAAGQLAPKLTPQQTEDYTRYRYLCKDTLHIPGVASRWRSNDIVVNGNKINMADEPFRLLVEFVVALKKGKGGWLTKVSEVGKYQIFDRVRKPLEGSLQDKQGKKFIESDGSKHYRISTHPDFVTYDLRSLKKHADSTVCEFAKKMPKM